MISFGITLGNESYK